MSADLHIHIFEGIDENDLKNFLFNCMGSKYCPLTRLEMDTPKEECIKIIEESHVFDPGKKWDDAYSKISKTPNIWIGEVSWLKAGLFDDQKYIPEPVGEISDIIGEDLPVIDDELIEKIRVALGIKNTTGYSTAENNKVIVFLEQHRGKKVFTISW